MDIYNFAQSTLNKIVVFTQSAAQNDICVIVALTMLASNSKVVRRSAQALLC